MPKYKIKRVVGDMTRDEVDAASLRSLWCLSDYPDVKWLHSMWDQERGEIICLYEATDPDQIRDHAQASRIPCDEVREVTIIDPDEYLHG